MSHITRFASVLSKDQSVNADRDIKVFSCDSHSEHVNTPRGQIAQFRCKT